MVTCGAVVGSRLRTPDAGGVAVAPAGVGRRRSSSLFWAGCRRRGMQYRLLGRSGTVVSNLALGTMTFGTETDEAGAHAQLNRFLDAGGNLVDTANVYSGGVSEEIIGNWLTSHAGRPQPDRAGDQGPVPAARRGERPRLVPPAPGAGPGCIAAPAADRLDRPVPGALARSADPDRGDAAVPRRCGDRRQDLLRRAVQLHRLAAAAGGRRGRPTAAGRCRSPCSRSTTCWCARSSGRSCRPAWPTAWACCRGPRSVAAG